jgi:hypothetical protein
LHTTPFHQPINTGRRLSGCLTHPARTSTVIPKKNNTVSRTRLPGSAQPVRSPTTRSTESTRVHRVHKSPPSPQESTESTRLHGVRICAPRRAQLAVCQRDNGSHPHALTAPGGLGWTPCTQPHPWTRGTREIRGVAGKPGESLGNEEWQRGIRLIDGEITPH